MLIMIFGLLVFAGCSSSTMTKTEFCYYEGYKETNGQNWIWGNSYSQRDNSFYCVDRELGIMSKLYENTEGELKNECKRTS